MESALIENLLLEAVEVYVNIVLEEKDKSRKISCKVSCQCVLCVCEYIRMASSDKSHNCVMPYCLLWHGFYG